MGLCPTLLFTGLVAFGCSDGDLPKEGDPCSSSKENVCESSAGPGLYACVSKKFKYFHCGNDLCQPTASNPNRKWNGSCGFSQSKGNDVCWCTSTGGSGDEVPPGVATWTDPATGLTWQNDTRYDGNKGMFMWIEDYCKDLVLGGHSDWRTPTIGELRSLIRGCPGTATKGGCKISDGCLSRDKACRTGDCVGCGVDGGPAGGCYWPKGMKGDCTPPEKSFYTSSRVAGNSWVWVVQFHTGRVGDTLGITTGSVRCVRK